MGNLQGQIRHVARFRIDMRQVAHQAKRPRHIAQVVGDQGLLHEHDVEARLLDFRAQTAHLFLAGDNLLGGGSVALGEGEPRLGHVGDGFFRQAVHGLCQLVELFQVFRTCNHHRQLNLPVR